MTWVGYLNFFLLQFFFVRLCRSYIDDVETDWAGKPVYIRKFYGYRLMLGVVPFTGWDKWRYRYVLPLKYIYSPYIWKRK